MLQLSFNSSNTWKRFQLWSENFDCIALSLLLFLTESKPSWLQQFLSTSRNLSLIKAVTQSFVSYQSFESPPLFFDADSGQMLTEYNWEYLGKWISAIIYQKDYNLDFENSEKAHGFPLKRVNNCQHKPSVFVWKIAFTDI